MSDFWSTGSLLLFGLVVAYGSRWLVAQLWQPRTAPAFAAGTLFADLLWAALVAAGGAIAGRYIERCPYTLPGYLALGLAAVLLSLGRAVLYQRTLVQRPPDRRPFLRRVLPTLTYLLLATVVFLILSLSAGRAEPYLLLPLYLGALLPGLDDPTSALGRLLPFVARRLDERWGRWGPWHSLGAALGLALLTAPLGLLTGWPAWATLLLGFGCHLALDLFQPPGLMLFWPLSRRRYQVLPRFRPTPGSRTQQGLAIALAVTAVLLLLTVDLGPSPAPVAPAPTFEQSLARYRGLQGRNLAFADVEGTWQAAGRRVRARFEILNASGRSLILLDRYTGRVFSAGQGGGVDLYLNSIRVVPGAPTSVRPVEIHLEDESLAAALSILYQMQWESGLQHIYVSGDLILPPAIGEGARVLCADYNQTGLRHIEDRGAGHFRLHYLTAAELIELAHVTVETADLIAVATYARPATGPTATPLPSPPAPEAAP